MEKFSPENLKRLDLESLNFIDELADLLTLTNPNALISLLGVKYTKKFINSFLFSENRSIYFYLNNDELVGYIFYLDDINTISKLRPNVFTIFYYLIRKPKLALKFYNAQNMNNFRKSFNNKTGYLMYLGVKKQFQSLGFGKKIIEHTIKLLDSNIETIITDTKSKKVEKFFIKSKFNTIYSKEDSFYLMKRDLK